MNDETLVNLMRHPNTMTLKMLLLNIEERPLL